MARLLCVISLVLACSGRPSAPAHRAPQPAPGPTGSAAPIVAVTSEDQCNALVEHALALGEAERPAEQRLASGERDNLVAELRASWSAACQQMTRRGYDCALAAKALAELEACGD